MELNSIKYNVENQIATIMLSRPVRRNSWTGGMHREYREAIAMAENDPGVRVIIVTGDPEGGTFCPGADMEVLTGMADKGTYRDGLLPDMAKPGYGVRPEFDASFAYHFGLTKPVIAAINGATAGVGLVLACYADMRFAAAGVKFTAAFSRLNLPSESGISWLLPRIVGVTNANDILMSSRVFLAEEALTMGLLNKVLPSSELMPHVRQYAKALVDNISPASLRMTKHQVYTDLHRPANVAVEEADKLLNAAINHPDAREGVTAFLEKRPAKWQGR